MQVVLVGYTGSGKTTLHNRITNSCQPAGYGGKSITISVYSKYAAYGNVPFKVLDTPGFGCLERKIYHYAGIIAALTDAPVTRILLVVKLDRIENMWKDVLPVLAPLRRFRQLISLMITHWDKCENQDRDRQLIEQHFEENNIKSFIYTSKDEDPILTCEKIIKEFQKSQPEVIKFMESELTTQFDLYELGKFEILIEELKADLLPLFHKKIFKMEQFIVQFELPELQKRKKLYLNEMKEEYVLLLMYFGFFSKQMPEISRLEYKFCEILHQVTLESQKRAKQCIKELMEKQSNLINEMVQENGQDFLFLIRCILKKELESHLNKIQGLAQTKILKVAGHCFNNIRKCNYCGQIWLNSIGCQGQTYCGAVPKNEKLNLSYRFEKWNKFWDNQEIPVPNIAQPSQSFSSQQRMNNVYDQQLNQIQTIQEENAQLNERKIGCGQIIEWNEMQKLSPGELQELVDPGLFSFLCQQDQEIQDILANANQPFSQLLQVAISEQRQNLRQS